MSILNAFRSEWILLNRKKLWLVLGVITTLYTVAATALVISTAEPLLQQSDGGLAVEALVGAGGATTAVIFSIAFGFMLVLATFISSTGNEFTRGTLRAALTFQSNRVSLMAGKFAARVLVAAILMAAALVIGAITAAVVAPAQDIGTGGWFGLDALADAVEDYVRAIAYVVGFAVIGTTIAVLVRSTPIALGIALLWFGPIENVIGEGRDLGGALVPRHGDPLDPPAASRRRRRHTVGPGHTRRLCRRLRRRHRHRDVSARRDGLTLPNPLSPPARVGAHRIARRNGLGQGGADGGGTDGRPARRATRNPTMEGATMTENTSTTKPTLVLGGTGKTGRRVVERLAALGVPVRIGSRPTQTTPFDWEDPSTWAPVLEDVRAVYIPNPDLVVADAPAVVRSFANLALEQEVRRMVLLSGRGEEQAQRAERAVQETGADVTVVRSAWFMQSFSEDYLLGPILDGEVVLPAQQPARALRRRRRHRRRRRNGADRRPPHRRGVRADRPATADLRRRDQRDRGGERPGDPLRPDLAGRVRRRGDGRRRARTA
ncbi:MAG: hypothetical protein WKF58_03545, partial [Ilumatobacteraceae bacterium]